MSVSGIEEAQKIWTAFWPEVCWKFAIVISPRNGILFGLLMAHGDKFTALCLQ